MKMHDEYLSAIQAGKYLGVTRQSIYFSIKRNLLVPVIINNKIAFTKDSLYNYTINKYNRRHIRKLRVDQYTVNEASEILGINRWAIYRLIRLKKMKFSKIRGQIIIGKNQIIEFLKIHSRIS